MINQSSNLSAEEVSLKELIDKIREWIVFLKKQWWKIFIAGALGGVLGFVNAWMQPITYTAKTTFVVEDAKGGSSLGGLASLAGQFGVDIGGGSGGSLFAGDNILLYFKSESLARQVLLSPWDSSKNISLADIYCEAYDLKKAWSKNKKIGDVSFPIQSGNQRYSRLQDSLLQSIVSQRILKGQFVVSRIDKKAGFIQLSISMRDEKLAKLYCERLVEIAVRRYVALKTERQQKTVDKLQSRADSISRLLNSKTFTSASLQTAAATMDVNPLYKTSNTIATELTSRDKTMLAAVYGEVIKNLELAKFTLSQETPVIQIVDSPRFPLYKERASRSIGLLVYGFLFALIVIIFLVSARYYRMITDR